MRLLLDTSVVIEIVHEPEATSLSFLSKMRFGAGIEPPVLVSAASIWEIAIKKNLGKLDAPNNLVELLAQFSDLAVIDVSSEDGWATLALPPQRDHKDPFDRLIIAQALRRDLAIATSDSAFARYGVPIIVA